MEIRIIFNEETEKVENVIVGDKYTQELGFDECLGIIAALVMPKERRSLTWLKTKEQHQAIRDYWSSNKDKPIILD
ncbi:hypothetical protein UFOVP754_30 [uncultured Caudovirales phage]|uniref:Uncharacterized protein n=1 Tax=uncultured Caudovirales phage TaxID=2100421 RepID=A0A6J7X5Z9_9CAUD|nr:hypothetical protein UFOVP754_30 [uncultured Caudovirales phage]